jgi:hypothetical protein
MAFSLAYEPMVQSSQSSSRMIPAIVACKINRGANGHERTSSIAEQMPIKDDSEREPYLEGLRRARPQLTAVPATVADR